jgi:polyisoprenoid-binding protein YceI
MTSTAVAATPFAIPAGTWRIDPAHSQVEFAVKHLMISTVRGRFGEVTGTLVVPERGTPTVEASIAATSVDTRSEQRDAHLRSPDFFDVEHHPALTFVGRHFEARGDEGRLSGDLTIRGVTREVTLAVESLGAARDPWGGERIAFTATTKLNRRDFGLTWNQTLETGGVLVSDDIRVTVEVQMVREG